MTSKKSKIELVEVTRSFSYKKVFNLGNYQSETIDFFCSQKAECTQDKAMERSEQLHLFCKNQVIKALNDYIQLQKQGITGTEVATLIKETPKKVFEKPWEKQNREFHEEALKEFNESGMTIDLEAPTYMASEHHGGEKVLFTEKMKQANTIAPF